MLHSHTALDAHVRSRTLTYAHVWRREAQHELPSQTLPSHASLDAVHDFFRNQTPALVAVDFRVSDDRHLLTFSPSPPPSTRFLRYNKPFSGD